MVPVPGVGGAVAGALAGKRCVLTGVFPEVNTALLPFRSCASKAEKGPVSTARQPQPGKSASGLRRVCMLQNWLSSTFQPCIVPTMKCNA